MRIYKAVSKLYVETSVINGPLSRDLRLALVSSAFWDKVRLTKHKSNIMHKNEAQLVCQNSNCGRKFPIVSDIPIMLPSLSKDFELTQEKWNEEYGHRYALKTINLSSDPELNAAS